MRLKTIEMQGFKSFPEKTRISIDNGVTAIIGPNGSGKSNISDAVRWVLGEMSLKSLRGSRMEDVIFNGAAGRQPCNYSSVSIILDTEEEFNAAQNAVFDLNATTGKETNVQDDDSANEKKQTKQKFKLSEHKEVAVTRRYYRSGESEYYINKTQVRLKDVYELFYDTGIGREGYSVIGQGKIAEVLSQKGDERRSIFEEAAGISKFRYKKSEAERKLKETENNLVRINDILNEVSSRIGPLAKEAENAKQYLVLSEEKKGLEITLWINKIDEIKVALEKGAVAFNSAKYELEQSEERVKSLEELLDGIINENYELSRLLSETERKKSEAGQTSGGLEAKKAVLLNDISHYKRIIEDNEQSINTARENIMSTSEQLAQAFAAAEEARNKAGEISAEVDRAQKEYENKHNETALLQTRLSEANSFYSELFEKKAKTLSTGAKIDAELELAARSKDGTAEIIATSERRISELSADIEKAESEEKLIKTEYENLRKQKDESENTISSLKSDLERIKDELVAKRLSLAADEQKREHLNRLEKLLEGYSESVRSVISDSKQGRIKKQNAPVEIYGTVSSLITAEGEYVIALETALGAALQFIVVGNEEDAKASIEYLKDNRLGRATFLPITTVRGKRCDISEIKDIPGFIGIASDLAKYNEKYTGIIEDLLGRTVVATELNAATRIAEKSGYKIKIVTCDGQVINPGGSFTGGSSAKKVGLLTRSLDIERLSSEIKKKNSEMLDIEREAANIRKKIDDLNEKNANLELILTEKKAAFDLLSSEKNTLAVRAEEEKKRRSSLLSGKNEDDTRLAMLLKQKEEYTLILKADGEKLDSSRLMLNELKEKAEAARAQEEDIYEKLNTERIRLLEGRTSAEHLGEQVLQLTERKSGFEKQIEEMQSFIDRTKSDISACESEITKIEEERSKVASEITGFDRLMDKMLSDREQKEKEINDTRHKVKQLQSEKDEAFRRFTSLEAEQNKLNKDYEDISSKLWDEYELTYSSAVSLRLPAEKMEKAHTRISSLKSRIRAMGSINVNALEEYRQEKERYDFLTAQTEDLNKTRKSLDNAISKLNIEMKQTFVESFEKINTAFGEVFTELFGGGSAYIELADPEMPLECGIDIIIRPPGKSVKNISLLSGGEQSFAAIALYLALQKINPAPFCIFDEIESSLDDVNVNKFADYVRQNSANTQYILITHRRGTMERADTLYGITMRQKGISEYIKLNIAMLQENLKEYTG